MEAIYVPARIAGLPKCPVRGIPIPWFVPWIDGKPEFRVADSGKRVEAVRQKKCWVCGDYLGKRLAFIIGPMCAVNRTTAEPPTHRECAEYSVRACPFLSRPKMERRSIEGIETAPVSGEMIMRNPGVMFIWMTDGFRPFGDGKGGWLIRLSDPFEVVAYREGRIATKEEVVESLDTGLPLLESMCVSDGDRAHLAKLTVTARVALGI